MANARRPPQPHQGRRVITTSEFVRWQSGLDGELRSRLDATIKLVREGGSTLGRPHVDTIHGSDVRKLKEARVTQSMRVLFAFDSNRNPVMLVGGDKAGKWNRWYRSNIRLAERLLGDHERRIGKEATCLSQRGTGRKSSPISR